MKEDITPTSAATSAMVRGVEIMSFTS